MSRMLLKEVYKTELQEKKYINMEKFKKLDKQQQIFFLATKGVKLGAGSSRVAYLVDSKRVLKTALNHKGVAQNKAELEIYTNPKIKDIVNKIYDYDPDGHWLLVELVRPITSQEEFAKLTGAGGDFEDMSFTIDNVLSTIQKSDDKEKVKEAWEIVDRWPKFYQDTLYAILDGKLQQGDVINTSPKYMDQIIQHWGKTADGRVVLLDYGFTEDVADEFYGGVVDDDPTGIHVKKGIPSDIPTAAVK